MDNNKKKQAFESKESEETALIPQETSSATEKAIEQAVSIAIEKTIPQVMLAVTHTLTLRKENSPLPPAAEMEGYEKILPGITNRFLTTYEQQTNVRLENETYQLVTDRKVRMGENYWKSLGLVCILIMAMCVFGLMAYCIHKELIWGLAALVSSGVIISIFSSFFDIKTKKINEEGRQNDEYQNPAN